MPGTVVRSLAPDGGGGVMLGDDRELEDELRAQLPEGSRPAERWCQRSADTAESAQDAECSQRLHSSTLRLGRGAEGLPGDRPPPSSAWAASRASRCASTTEGSSGPRNSGAIPGRKGIPT